MVLCLSVTSWYSAETAKLIEMTFGVGATLGLSYFYPTLVSFHTAEHIRDEIRRIDGSVHHHHPTLCWKRIRVSPK